MCGGAKIPKFTATTWGVVLIAIMGLLLTMFSDLVSNLQNNITDADTDTRDANINQIKSGITKPDHLKKIKNKLMTIHSATRHDKHSNEIISSSGYFIPDLILMGPDKSGTSSFGANINKYVDIEYYGKEARYWGLVKSYPYFNKQY